MSYNTNMYHIRVNKLWKNSIRYCIRCDFLLLLKRIFVAMLLLSFQAQKKTCSHLSYLADLPSRNIHTMAENVLYLKFKLLGKKRGEKNGVSRHNK